MQKDKGYMPAIILCIICLVTTGLLALTNQLTYGPRLVLEAAALKANQQEMFPTASEFKQLDIEALKAQYPGVVSVAIARNADGAAGVLIQSSSRGYAGSVPVLVAIDKAGLILNLKYLTNDETPGLGKKVEDRKFFGQFIGKKTDKPFTVKFNESGKTSIDAVAGATISSRAVTEAVNAADSIYLKIAAEVK